MRNRRLFVILGLTLLFVFFFSFSAFAQAYNNPAGRPPAGQQPPGPPPGQQPPGPPPGQQPGGINQALDMCYANCVRNVQMCLRPTLAPGYNKQAAANVVNNCTNNIRPCMLNCLR